jgi:plasmid stability protein
VAQILVRGLSEQTIERLRKHARARNRSLEAEVRNILEQSAEQSTLEEFRETARELRAEFGGRVLPDSTPGIREDRER